MRFSRAILPVALLSALLLTGCDDILSPPEPSPSETAPSAAPTDPGSLIGGTIDPAGTTWRGTDSGGDLTVLTLHADHTLAVAFGDNHYDDASDSWSVHGGILHLSIHLDATDGVLQYTGTWNPEKQQLAATATTTRTGRTLTVALTQD